MADIICPQCKAPNRSTSQFCAECGTPLLEGVGSQVSAPSPRAPQKKPDLSTHPVDQGQKILQRRYRIEEQLGAGGFGSVYRAWDLNLERPCAIKENLGSSSDAQRQFMREATVLANLSHQNLPRVIDHFIIPNQGQYLVMDFVEGEDLEHIMTQREVIPVSEALEWVLQVVGALEYLHQQKPPVFHRDIKPANIRISPSGKAMLVDFGLVKIFDPYLTNTTEGARAVTPGYAPPEQYGRGGTDARTDIYALGATLYSLITGHEPLESVRRMVGEHLPTAHSLNPSVPLLLSDALERAMALDPKARFQTALEFQATLRLVQTELGKSRPPAVSLVTQVLEPEVEEIETIAVQAPVSLPEQEAQPDVEVLPEPEEMPPSEKKISAPVLETVKMEDVSKPITPVSPPAQAKPVSVPPKAALPQAKIPSQPWRSNKTILIGAVAAAVLCLAVAGGLIAYFSSRPGSSSTAGGVKVGPVEATLTSRFLVQSTVDWVKAATATAGARSTEQKSISITGTAIKKATNEQTGPTFTLSAVSTQASTGSKATEKAVSSYLSGIENQATLAFGPRSGRMAHREEDRTFKSIPASVGSRNFILESTFINPYSSTEGDFDFGLVFRYSTENTGFLIVFTSDKTWRLISKTGAVHDDVLAEGKVGNMKTAAGEANKIKFYAVENTGYLYLNEIFIDQFDISKHYSGAIRIGIGFYPGTEKTGKLTEYKDFTVWTLPIKQ